MFASLAPWNSEFSSAVAAELESEPFVTFSLANVDRNGLPHTRTCVYRGFLFDDAKTNILLFTCDKRSSKYKDLIANANFEACFYFHKLHKQFRFSGAARVITDDQYPIISFNKAKLAMKLQEQNVNQENGNKEDGLVVEQEPDFYSSRIDEVGATEPITYRVLSPSQSQAMNYSSTSLADLNKPTIPPTEAEWKAERQRCWNALSRSLKRSFKRPAPGTQVTEEKYKLLDSINRGVDGTSSGQENFVVVCLFVKAVDLVELTGGVDRRYLYKKSYDIDAWKEYEVCP
ncbi:hypothetical protein OGAPHI_006399 [Ogataea philodendri]|uniref:Pyridoxamine 5'-phosphate oxidase Alr4036 family FMN-binding domain-containing protein n=1 Tax=Ogataea philodendri TaxID=1378263 RepID=A0A9P8T1D3_9ASCO|nr:uncharacterized protein OGAPHI_006399 [Ogataea philodendri]KAH3661551.1 hypothetical protein OGAPHI_006399 [Ogataea philodendri]